MACDADQRGADAGRPAGRDVFPNTAGTWIARQARLGAVGREAINRHVMMVYAEPLRVYCRGCSYRTLGDADDLVHGFLASRLPRPDFFDAWMQSGLRMRRWLMNALLFYLREEARRQRRGRLVAGAEPAMDEGRRPALHDDVDRAWARAVVRDAFDVAASSCRADSLDRHWTLFIEHYLHGRPYATLAGDVGDRRRDQRTPASASTMMTPPPDDHVSRTLEAADGGVVSALLRLGLAQDRRPVDALIARVEAPDGAAWLAGVLESEPALRPGVSLERLRACKQQARTDARADPEDHRALLIYYLSVGTALAEYGVQISSVDHGLVAAALVDFAEVLPDEWSRRLRRAALVTPEPG